MSQTQNKHQVSYLLLCYPQSGCAALALALYSAKEVISQGNTFATELIFWLSAITHIGIPHKHQGLLK